MAEYNAGILIDYEFCTGCHSCEIACKNELKLETGKWGIKLTQVGPWKLDARRWQLTYIPVPTELCDLCADRVSHGKQPACIQHCQSACMQYGNLEDLAKQMTAKPRQVLFAPK